MSEGFVEVATKVLSVLAFLLGSPLYLQSQPLAGDPSPVVAAAPTEEIASASE
jgi:hypothetical protein